MAFDFPTSPSVGQQYTPAGGPTYQWNGSVWIVVATAGFTDAPGDGSLYGRLNAAWAKAVKLAGDTMTGLLTLSGDPATALQAATKQYADTKITSVNTLVYTTSTTYTPSSPNVKYVEVTGFGGGGAGGGAAGTAAAQSSCGSGGYAGAKAVAVLSLAAATGQAITIGAGGSPVAGAAGNAGSPTTFGAALLSAAGGPGGLTVAAANAPITASLNSPAQSAIGALRGWTPPGTVGVITQNAGGVWTSGCGGGNEWGGGANGVGPNATGANAVGSTGGGSGGANIASVAAKAGGAGANGLLIIKEYIA